MDQMGLQEMTVMFTIAVIMVLTKFALLESQWEAILTVCCPFFAIWFFSQNLLVLMNYLRVHVKPMYQLYSILKDHDEPPMPEEIDIASGKRQLDGKAEAEYLKKLKKSSENIKKVF